MEMGRYEANELYRDWKPGDKHWHRHPHLNLRATGEHRIPRETVTHGLRKIHKKGAQHAKNKEIHLFQTF